MRDFRRAGKATMRGTRRTMTWVILVVVGVAAVEAQQAVEGQLFPEPFLVEHHVVQTLPDGDVFSTEPVTDYYGGSWIVSVRGDGSRLVVDFARRELIEIRPERSTFSVLSFDHFAELTRRFQAVERPAAAKRADASAAGLGDEPKIRFKVTEAPVSAGVSSKSARFGAGRDLLVERAGVRQVEVTAFVDGAAEPAASMVFWLDPRIRFTLRAQAAMEEFECTVVASGSVARALGFSRLAAEARKAFGGALAFRSRRPLALGGAPGEAGFVDDLALRVEMIDVFPSDLLQVPAGSDRAPHPLELMVSYAEREAELRAAMGAAHAAGQPDGGE